MASDLPPDSAEMVRILTKRTRRGLLIFNVLRIAFWIWLGWAILTVNYYAAAAAFFGGMLFHLGLDHVQKRDKTYRLIASNPQLVYWAHATTVTQAMAEHPVNSVKPLTVHLRNGEQAEVTLAPDEVRVFMDWLRLKNPSVRWGRLRRRRRRVTICG